MLLSLRLTSPRLIKSPPTQPRRASVAMILRMRPAPSLVFEGSEPEGWTGDVIKRDQFGLGLGLDDFFRLRKLFTPVAARRESQLNAFSMGQPPRYCPRAALYPTRRITYPLGRLISLVLAYCLSRWSTRAKGPVGALHGTQGDMGGDRRGPSRAGICAGRQIG